LAAGTLGARITWSKLVAMHVARSQTNEGVPSPGEPGNVVVRTRRRGRDDAVKASGAGKVYSAVVGLAPSSRRDVGLGLGGKRDVRSDTPDRWVPGPDPPTRRLSEQVFGGIGATIRGPVSTDSIVIRGAREHNLKNLTLELPRDKLIVFTGISGSGKSSLAFDTIYA